MLLGVERVTTWHPKDSMWGSFPYITRLSQPDYLVILVQARAILSFHLRNNFRIKANYRFEMLE